MVTIRDVTALKALEKETANQKRELEIIGQILSIDRGRFNEFLQSAYDFIDKNRALIQNNDAGEVATLFRNMHTIKGNARTYGFNYITNEVHDAEVDLRPTA